MQFRDEKEAVQVALQLSQREAAEARGLWETEIRSRASMSLRVSPLFLTNNSASHMPVTWPEHAPAALVLVRESPPTLPVVETPKPLLLLHIPRSL